MKKRGISVIDRCQRIMSLALCLMVLIGAVSPLLSVDVTYAETAKLEIVGTPTVYVQSGGDNIVSLKVKNISNADIKGVNLYHGWKTIESYGNENGFIAGSSEYSSMAPGESEAESYYRFTSYFENADKQAVNATWIDAEEGYTIAKGKTATLWFKIRSRYEKPGTYNEWIKLGNIHTDYAYGIIPVPIVDEAFSGQLPVKVVVYNPQGAAITMGTSSNNGVSISTVAVGNTINFGSVNLAGSSNLIQEKTIYTRNTSTGSGSDNSKDEHALSTDIKVDLSVDTPQIVQWSYDYPFGCNSNLMNGMSWAPLPASSMNANSFQAAKTGITLDAREYIAGTYTATLNLYTTPHGVKVNGSKVNTSGVYSWPVKVTLTGTNPRIPKAPTNIKTSPGNGQVEVTWKAPSGAQENMTYEVYRRLGAETDANKKNLNNANFNWKDYEYVGSASPKSDGSYIFVDGSVTNNKSYTYVIIGGMPLKAYPGISGDVTPKSSISSKIQAPELFGAEREGGVLLEWEMNENYGGDKNDGSSLVDYFNVYRDGVLVAQVKQNAVIEDNEYDSIERPAPTPDDPDATEWVYGIKRTSYSWEYFAETPLMNQNYTWEVAAVSKNGIEGYKSEAFGCNGATDELVILGHTASVNLSDVPYAEIKLETSDYNSPEKVSYWRSEGTLKPDTSKAPIYTYSRNGYSIDTDFDDRTIKKGKTYTYTAQTEDSEGNKSNYYTFQIKVPSGNNWWYRNFSSTDITSWEIVDGKTAKLSWYADTDTDDDGNWFYTGTYKVYRNNTQIKSFSPSGQTGGSLLVTDNPGKDGTYVYRVDKVVDGITIRGRDYTFVRNTSAVNTSSFLKAPSAPVLDVSISDGVPVLRWAPTNSGGEVEGYHIYRRDAGELVNSYRKWSNYNQTIYMEDRYWPNKRYITIESPNTRVLADERNVWFQGDQTKGYLNGVSWDEDSCPHEYWITAYNQVGESAPSKVARFDFQGVDEDDKPIAPGNDDDFVPGTPTITDLWIDWEDNSNTSSEWDDSIGGNLHIAWEDGPSQGYTDHWDFSVTGLSDEWDVQPVYAWQVAADSNTKLGTSGKYSPTFYVNAENGNSGDYGRTASVVVTAENNSGTAKSKAATIKISSFPRFRAIAGNNYTLLQWTDLFKDTTTKVNSWEIWRKRESGSWSKIKTLTASSLTYAKDSSGNYKTDSNGVKNYEYKDTTAENGWNYEYKVIAKCGDKVDRPSVVRNVMPKATASTVPPGAPTNLKATVINGEVLFTWTKPTGEPQAYDLLIERTYGNGSKYWESLGSVNAPSTSYVWSQTNAGTFRAFVYSYSYINGERLPRGKNVWEDAPLIEIYPSMSNIVTFKITQAQIDGQAESEPKKFDLSAAPGDSQVKLTWTKSEGATYYEIERVCLGNEDTREFPAITVSSSTLTYTDKTAEPGVRYEYRVTAKNIYGGVYNNVYAVPTGKTHEEIIIEEQYDEIIKPVQEQVNALPSADKISESNMSDVEEAIKSARDAYNNITPASAKKLVDISKLEKAEEKIKALKQQEENQKAADKVKELIQKLPDNPTAEDKDRVEAARKAFDALSDAQKALVPAATKKALETKEEVVNELTKPSLKDGAVSGVSVKTYTGSALTQSPTVKMGDVTLKSGTDYTITYKNNVNAGTATMTLTGKGDYAGSKSVTFKINPAKINIPEAKTGLTYTGKSQTGVAAETGYTVTGGSGTKVGNYTAVAKLNDTSNYTWSDGTTADKTIKWSIAEAPKEIWHRLYGEKALDTMEAIINEGIKDGKFKTGGTVIIATAGGFHDALAAAGLAGRNNAAVVLTKKTEVKDQTIRVLKALNPSKVYIAGGDAAVTEAVENAINRATGKKAERLAGDDAADTSARMALAANNWSKDKTAIIATNGGFHDALAAAPVAYAKGYPILLASKKGTTLKDPVKNAIKTMGIKKVIIVGGEGAVSEDVEKELIALGIKNIERLEGETAIETSARIAEWGLTHGMTPNYMGVATSADYYDALSGAALCGANNTVLVLEKYSPKEIPKRTNVGFPAKYRTLITDAYVFGGEMAVTKITWNALVASTR